MTKEKIAIFDFDGTITSKDSMLDLALKHFGPIKFYCGLIRIIPKILLCKLGIISNSAAKEGFLTYFYHQMNYDEFVKICTKYSLEEIDKITKPAALAKINFYKSQDYKMIIVSASLEEWIKPWALKNGFTTIITSKIMVENDKITGKLNGKNCYGEEKVNRFISCFGPFENYYTVSFGDSKSDKKILEKSNEAYYRKYE